MVIIIAENTILNTEKWYQVMWNDKFKVLHNSEEPGMNQMIPRSAGK